MSGYSNLSHIKAEMEQLRKMNKLFETIFETAYEGIVITDAKGIIRHINQTYADFLEIDPVSLIGEHCTKVIPNTRMHIVGETGIPELNQVQRIKGGNMIVHRIPVTEQNQVVMVIGKVLFQNINELHSLSAKVAQLQKELNYFKGVVSASYQAKYGLDHLIGDSSKMDNLKKRTNRVASNDTTVLITGESGTGKELLAHAIHNHSYRKYGPFVKVNCAEIPETLVESILFGYEEGAFTGAIKGGKKGKFEIAQGGTIFLDEIGELSPILQAKLLRVLQEKEIEPVGGTKPVTIDTRIIAATHCNLKQMVEEGKFRSDLYYRLHVFALHMPSLRERMEDLPQLVNHFLKQLASELGIYVDQIDEKFLSAIQQYHWPGNVRELRNILESSLLIMEGNVLQADHLPEHLSRKARNSKLNHQKSIATSNIRTLKDTVEEAERSVIMTALQVTQGNRTKAAEKLGISRSVFYEKAKKYELL